MRMDATCLSGSYARVTGNMVADGVAGMRREPCQPQTGTWVSLRPQVIASRDPRWRPLIDRLATLREAGRRSVRILDIDCGAGHLLIDAARHARAIGFVAIEGLGADRSARLIHQAREQVMRLSDPAIGLLFDVTDPIEMLHAEAAFPADIVLYADPVRPDPVLEKAVIEAGVTRFRVTRS